MSEVVRFVCYYGPGTVRSNEQGVDLSEFQCVEMQLPNHAEKVSITQFQQWLVESFRLDRETVTVTIQSLWSSSRETVYWQLKPIDRTSQWVHWLTACKRRGSDPVALVQAVRRVNPSSEVGGGSSSAHGSSYLYLSESVSHEEDRSGAGHDSNYGYREESVSHGEGGRYESGESSQAEGYSYSGEVDGDEEGEHLQEQMEEEDIDGSAEDLNSDDSDEEVEDDEPIPGAWNRDFSNAMTVQDGHESNWEYHQNNIAVGAMYPTKKHLKEAIINWAMSTQRVFKTVESSPKNLTMKCENTGCPGRVHGYLPKYDHKWLLSDIEPHTCVIPTMLTRHRNLTSTLVAQLLYSEIVERKAQEVKGIQNAIHSRYKYTISYGCAWRAKQMALERRFGSFFDAYDNVVRLLHTLQERNPGTYVNIQHLSLPMFEPAKVLHRVFFSFSVMIDAFRYCRPVIMVDGTFLTGKYKGQILTAIGTDGNNQLVPLAMAFVEGENYSSWLWFFRQVKLAIVKNRRNVCILHDRHAGILKAIKTLTQATDGEPTPWPDMQSRWCMRHLGANFFSQFKSKNLMSLFKKLCKQNQQWKYDYIRDLLMKLTEKQVRERRAARAAAVAAHLAEASMAADDPVGLCDLPEFDPPGTRRKEGRRIKNFGEWIEKEPLEKWSLLHDTHGARFGIMTTNLAEVYNFVLQGNRALPLTAIVEGVLYGTMKYCYDKRTKAELISQLNPNSLYCEKITEYMEKKIQKARSHTVTRTGNKELKFEVRLSTDKFGVGNEMRTQEVTLTSEGVPTCECTCNKPKLLGLPCSHVLAVCGQLQMDHNPFVSAYFSKEAVLNTWGGELNGFRVRGNFNTVNPVDRRYIPHPELIRTKVGRRNTRRIRNDMDESETAGPLRQCLLCNQFGHRANSCETFGTGGARGRGRVTRARRRGRATQARGRGNVV